MIWILSIIVSGFIGFVLGCNFRIHGANYIFGWIFGLVASGIVGFFSGCLVLIPFMGEFLLSGTSIQGQDGTALVATFQAGFLGMVFGIAVFTLLRILFRKRPSRSLPLL